MRVPIDSGKLLYALGVAFAAAALLYFVRDVVFGLSITVKAALLFLLFVSLFLAGLTAQRDVLDVVAFALAGVTYVVFVGYVVVRYGPSETVTFLLLAFSAGLFVGLGYLLREGRMAVPRRRAIAIAAGLLLMSGALVGFDAVGGGVAYDVTTESSVTVEPVATGEPAPYSRYERRVATVTASNEFVFTRALSLPDLRGCLVGPGSERQEVYLSYDDPGYDRPDTIGGGVTREFPVLADLRVDRNQTEPVSYAVERGSDCGADRAEPTLLVAVGDGEQRAG